MAITSGFFASKNGDRRYNNEQFSMLFDGLITDGVFNNIGNRFLVRQTEPASMSIIVRSGKAWFNHIWLYNSADESFIIAPNARTDNRIDTVAIQIDFANRTASIVIVQGAYAGNPVPPTLSQGANQIWQYPLAYIRVNSGVSAITTANITDAISKGDCPLVTAVIQNGNFSDLLAPLEAQFKTSVDERIAYWDQAITAMQDLISEDTGTEILRGMREIVTPINVTLSANNWTTPIAGENIYVQEVEVEGMDIGINPILTMAPTNFANVEAQAEYLSDFKYIATGFAETGAGTVTFKTYGGHPANDITVSLRMNYVDSEV